MSRSCGAKAVPLVRIGRYPPYTEGIYGAEQKDLRGCNRQLRKFQPELVACDHGSQYIVSKGVTQMLSERIYQFRRKSGLSQEQLAEKIGVSRQAISKWESGTSMPEFQKLLALSECFHITLDELVKDRGAEERTEETRSTPKEAKGPKAMDQKAGICLCLAGAICLTLSGLMMVISPGAAEQLNTASTITLNGSGVLIALCVLLMVTGAVLILRKK